MQSVNVLPSLPMLHFHKLIHWFHLVYHYQLNNAKVVYQY